MEKQLEQKDEKIAKLETKLALSNKELKEARKYISERDEEIKSKIEEFDGLIAEAKKAEEQYKNQTQELALLKKKYTKEMNRVLK